MTGVFGEGFIDGRGNGEVEYGGAVAVVDSCSVVNLCDGNPWCAGFFSHDVEPVIIVFGIYTDCVKNMSESGILDIKMEYGGAVTIIGTCSVVDFNKFSRCAGLLGCDIESVIIVFGVYTCCVINMSEYSILDCEVEYGGAVAVIGSCSVVDLCDGSSWCAGLISRDVEPVLRISIVSANIVKNMSKDGILDGKVEYGGRVAVVGTCSIVDLCDGSSGCVGLISRDVEPVLRISIVSAHVVKNMSEDGVLDVEVQYGGRVAVIGTSSVIDSDKFSRCAGFLGCDVESILSIFGVYTDFVKNISEYGIFDGEVEYDGRIAVVGSSLVIDPDKFSRCAGFLGRDIESVLCICIMAAGLVKNMSEDGIFDSKVEDSGTVAVISTGSVVDSNKFSWSIGFLGCDIEPVFSISIVSANIIKNMSEDGVFDSKVEYGGAVTIVGTSSVVNLCDGSSWCIGFLCRDVEPIFSISIVATNIVNNMSEDGILDGKV